MEDTAELRGTVERPGGEPRQFRSATELIAILTEGDAVPDPQAGYGPGSTSSSTILDT